MSIRIAANACIAAAAVCLVLSGPANADGPAIDDTLFVTASSCAAAQGSWRDNGDVSSCCVEAACYVCEVDALQCQIEIRPGTVFTHQQLVDLLNLVPAASTPIGQDAS
jgi:hypothetical protein